LKLIPAIEKLSLQPTWITTEEILYVCRNKRMIEFHTYNGVFRTPQNITEYYALLQADRFVHGEVSSSIINLDKVTSFDKKRKIARFEHISGMNLEIEVSRRNMRTFQKVQ
jgi:DNA-binding LytR/AlgR family response regulator